MTNPNNAIGTPAAFSGRSSVKGFNDLTQAFSRGIISGWEIAPKSGMTVNVGGNASIRDAAVAEDAAGNRTTIDNRLGTAVAVTIATAPAANSRIDAIVAYVQPNPTGDGTTQDNPSVCGIIPVQGTTAANPTEPTEAQIRTAITADGGTGGSAYYVVLGTILVGANVTTIGSGVITQGAAAQTVLVPTPVQKIWSIDAATAPTQITGSTWTATESGFVRVTTGGSADVNVQIDNRQWLVIPSGYAGNQWFPIGKGQVVKPSTTDTSKMTLYFFKGKWCDAA